MNIKNLPYTTGLSMPFLDNEKGQKEVCPICLDNDQFTYKSWVKTKCSHYFHRHCIDLWLETRKVCPICIQEITDENIIIIVEEMEEMEEKEETEKLNE
jgi:RNA polymerase subunit RPABC4/transcription elongation factor Spt4